MSTRFLDFLGEKMILVGSTKVKEANLSLVWDPKHTKKIEQVEQRDWCDPVQKNVLRWFTR